jgi:hypothetical protein
MTATSELIRRPSVDAFGRTPAQREEYQRLCDAVNKEASANWDNPTWRREMAADLTTSIQYGFEFESLFPTFVDTRNVGFTDRIVIRETRGLQVFWTARGGYIEESQLRHDVWELPRDTLGFHVSEHEDKLTTNFAESIAELRRLAIIRMDAEVNRRLHDLLAAAIPSGSPYYVSAAGIQKTDVDAAIRAVRDADPANAPVTIIGRSTVVDQITDFTGFGNETVEEIRQRGSLGVYRGARIVSLKNYLDEDDLPFLPANEMFILSGSVGTFAYYGGMLNKQGPEAYNWYYHFLGRRDMGGLIHHPERARRIIDTEL